VYRYIRAEKACDLDIRVAFMCRVLGVSRSGYYQWCRRPHARPVHARLRIWLWSIRSAGFKSRFRYYGSPMIRAELLTTYPRLG
jgi:putative transposase